MSGDAPSVDGGITAHRGGFVFDEHVAPHFDSHVRKSVPDYDHVQNLAAQLSDWFAPDGSHVIDLGCSTGTTLEKIKQRNPEKKLTLRGYDNSREMFAQAKKKGIDVELLDIGDVIQIQGYDYGVSLYTMQFLKPGQRAHLLGVLHDCMKDGGALFVVEKVLGSVPEFQDLTAQLYWDMKLANGLKPEEVLNKAAALRGVMRPMTVAENEKLFRAAGFARYELIYRNLQFAGWVIQK